MNVQQKIRCKVPFGTMNIPARAIKLINSQLRSGMVTNGSCVKQFESDFSKEFGSSNAVAVSSGTDADTLALAALHYIIKTERNVSEIIIPALTFIATANAVINAGFKPVFVDVRRDTLQIDETLIEAAITPNTVGIMPVHLMGKPAKMDVICEIAEKHNLTVVEDCAEAHGAWYKGQQVGTFGIMSCYSLYAAHIVSSIEGGMITSNSEKIDQILRSLRNHGLNVDHKGNWKFDMIGFSAKMNELEAAVGIWNLNNFTAIRNKRRTNFTKLIEGFRPFYNLLTLKEEDYEYISPHAFSIIVKEGSSFKKEELVEWYNQCGIDNRNLFYSIPTQCEVYQKYSNGQFSEAEFCSNNGTHIGAHQDLTDEQINYVIEKTKEFIHDKKRVR